ncbi:MAG: entericidin A/B family lipoprotein [Legionella sp.]|nr:entericidin A/B family lipoprotein [Legionella sp.]
MKSVLFQIAVSFLALSLSLLTSCNTVKGAGRDISNTGDAIERAAN